MDADRTSTFENARRFERELNGRQREILELLAKGRKNAEIAEALNLTFSGAKWNVSEILSKLGLDSREEAAEYWRWRQGIGTRTRSALRALVPAGLPVKLVAGGGFAAVAVVVVLVLALLMSPDEPPESSGPVLEPFRLTATTTQGEGASEYVSTTSVEWLDARHYRSHVASDAPGAPEFVVVADGQVLWHYIQSLQQYSRAAIPEVSFDEPASEFFYMHYGPMAGAPTVDDLLRELRVETGAPDPDAPKYANIVGDDILLGRRVVVIEYGPLWNDSTPEKRAAGWGINSGGAARAWIDPETMFILRNEAEVTSEIAFRTEVTSLEFGERFDPADFAFEPGPGASEVPAGLLAGD